MWRQDHPEKDGPYVKSRDVSKVSTTPLSLPDGFEWCEIDVSDDMEALKLCVFLQSNSHLTNQNPPNGFTPMYTIEYIRWLLSGPDAKKELHLGIKSKDKLMGFIAGTTVKT